MPHARLTDMFKYLASVNDDEIRPYAMLFRATTTAAGLISAQPQKKSVPEDRDFYMEDLRVWVQPQSSVVNLESDLYNFVTIDIIVNTDQRLFDEPAPFAAINGSMLNFYTVPMKFGFTYKFRSKVTIEVQFNTINPGVVPGFPAAIRDIGAMMTGKLIKQKASGM